MLLRFSSKMGGMSWHDMSYMILIWRSRTSNQPCSTSLLFEFRSIMSFVVWKSVSLIARVTNVGKRGMYAPQGAGQRARQTC